MTVGPSINLSRKRVIKALRILEEQLQQTPYFIGGELSTADISLYAYTLVAEEGGFDLRSHPALRLRLNLIQSEPKYVGM